MLIDFIVIFTQNGQLEIVCVICSGSHNATSGKIIIIITAKIIEIKAAILEVPIFCDSQNTTIRLYEIPHRNEYKIDFNNNSLKIHNKIRALTGPGCYTYYKQKRVKLLDTYYSNDNIYNLSLGEFEFDKDNVMIIGCRMGILLVYKLQFSGKNPITSKEFHNQNISSYFFECNE